MRRPFSLRMRFVIVSVASVTVALGLSALFMASLFASSLERRLEAELTADFNTVAASLKFSPEGRMIRPQGPLDRRFAEPYGGLYWQVEDQADKQQFRSPSLWDYTLPLHPPTVATAEKRLEPIDGPEGAALLVLHQRVIMTAAGVDRVVHIAVAADLAPLHVAERGFVFDMLPYVAALGLFLIGASLVQLTFGLRPLHSLTDGLNAIRERRQERLEGRFPAEFEAVAAAVNRLLESQSAAMRKARSRAGDLAHGLKTPLTIISNDALTLRERGETEIAEEIERLSGQMRLYVDRELTRSRIAVSADMRQSDADLALIAGQVVRTLKRTPQGETLAWTINAPAAAMLPIDPHDLRELVGNLLENAMKWASHTVTLHLAENDGSRHLVIEDDGPGVGPEFIERMTERGVRLDLQAPGSGLGLAIVRDICDVYGLVLKIENRAAGGLRVSIGF